MVKKAVLLGLLSTFIASFVVSNITLAQKIDSQYWSNNDILYYDPRAANTCAPGGMILGGTTNEEKVWNWLISKKMTTVGAAGIMGNMALESGFNPLRFQTSATNEAIWQYDGGMDGYNGNAWGLVQWDGPRRLDEAGTGGVLGKLQTEHPDYRQYINDKYGRTAESYAEAPPEVVDWFINYSMEYLFAEANPGGNRGTVWADLLNFKPTGGDNTNNVIDATVLFHNDFEGSADTADTVRNNRGAAAVEIFTKFGGTAPATGSTPASDSATPSGCGDTETKPAATGDFIYYSQLDPKWSGLRLGTEGYIGADGCGPTSFAMVVATLKKDTSITPVEMTALGEEAGSITASSTDDSASFASAIVSKYPELTSTSFSNLSDTVEYVKGGGLVVVSGASLTDNTSSEVKAGPFSRGGHFVVIKSITEDGKLVIANPYSGTLPVPGQLDTAPEAWPQEQTFELSHFDGLDVRGITGFKLK